MGCPIVMIGKMLTIFLQHFYELTQKVSSSNYVTANNFFEEICNVYFLLRDWQLSGDVVLGEMAKRIQDKYDKYWGNIEKMNKLLYVAIVLDPQNKLEFVEYCFKRMNASEEAEVITKKSKGSNC